MAGEPSGGQPRNLFLGFGLAGQAGVAGNDGQVALTAQLLTGSAVEVEDNLVMAVHDQERRRAHQAQPRPGQVGSGRPSWQAIAATGTRGSAAVAHSAAAGCRSIQRMTPVSRPASARTLNLLP